MQPAGDPTTIFHLTRALRAPRKLIGPVRERIRELTPESRRMSNEAIAHMLSDSMILISARSVSRARAWLEFHDGDPIGTVSLTERQKNATLCFARSELERDWGNVLFTNESYFWLKEDAAIIGGSGETGAMMFASIGESSPKWISQGRIRRQCLNSDRSSGKSGAQ
jgi:hypothetical protein